MTLVEQEVVRARWRRALEDLGLDNPRRIDFALGGLAGRLRAVTVQVVLLPQDPEVDVITVDDTFSAWLEAHHRVDFGEFTIELPPSSRRTAHAVALVDSYEDQIWESYIAVYRSGALEFGLGVHGGWDGHDGGGNAIHVTALTPTVARVWAFLRFASVISAKEGLTGPWQLSVALPRTGLLGALGEGWAEPGDFNNGIGNCHDERLLWHLVLPELPDDDGARAVAYSVGDRLEDAWGAKQRRYLAHRGNHHGQIDPRYTR